MATITLSKKLGMLLLGIWLILQGLIHFLTLSFAGLPTIMALLALVAGIIIVIDR